MLLLTENCLQIQKWCMPIYNWRGEVSVPICAKIMRNGPASANQGCSIASQGSCHMYGRLCPPIFPYPASAKPIFKTDVGKCYCVQALMLHTWSCKHPMTLTTQVTRTLKSSFKEPFYFWNGSVKKKDDLLVKNSNYRNQYCPHHIKYFVLPSYSQL